ncbi:MAG: type I-E CRISPR-associated endonuclease Cas1e [Chloroflexota bacterium]
MLDLHLLPKVRDSWSYLYVEHCKIDQEDKAIAIHDDKGVVPVPCAALSVLMLGPGTTIPHAAVRAQAENGCLAFWTGEEGVRFYAQGLGETRSARNLLRQARLWADPKLHLDVVLRMYSLRFGELLDESLNLRQIRGKEGMRVRAGYAEASRRSGVPWNGRTYQRDLWGRADPVNRALSAANSCLYGICHAAIVSAGYSPALGFIHTGKMLSFVYDVADLYKMELSVPVAFAETAKGGKDLERRVRLGCRDAFKEQRLLQRVVSDIEVVLGKGEGESEEEYAADAAAPGGLWDPEEGAVAGGVNREAEAGGGG